ncbi:MAG TPA: DUF72 domain-containing protein [Sandaracinaceae bacterium LLY-WYZ-13_1]|nr:DUF72 domain-containing protein [Sandaracinaceae bacterium LLY-WYZ-13_1]
MAGRLHVGTSGWNYDWPDFYEGVAKSRRLEGYARVFDSVEINGSFYRLQKRATYRKWRDLTPRGFRFAVKANRYLTHNKKLKDATGPISLERDRAKGLGAKHGATLWQLPRQLRRDDERLDAWLRTLSRKWPSGRHVLEPRHPSWFHPKVADALAARDVAFCMSDSPDWPLWERANTDLVYVRLHGHTRLYHSRYSKRSLEHWAERIVTWLRQGRGVYVFFDNTDSGHAPKDAMRLRRLVGDA